MLSKVNYNYQVKSIKNIWNFEGQNVQPDQIFSHNCNATTKDFFGLALLERPSYSPELISYTGCITVTLLFILSSE